MNLPLEPFEVEIVQIALLLMKKHHNLQPHEVKDVDEILAYIKKATGHEPVV